MGEDAQEMHIDPARAAALASRLSSVRQRIAALAGDRNIRLVAVSKLQPANDILALHRAPARQVHFGENYAQELAAKAALLPPTVRWHFVGGLQSGHCRALAGLPNLFAVSGVDTPKKARLLDARRAALRRDHPDHADAAAAADATQPPPVLAVHVQVNTSGEPSKSGCRPGPDTVALCRLVRDECPALRLLGLMTIGSAARSLAAAAAAADADEGGTATATATGGNDDFAALRDQRDLVARELGVDPASLELSMGMSADFEAAVAQGSGEVRVGSTIFGPRPDRADAKIRV